MRVLKFSIFSGPSWLFLDVVVTWRGLNACSTVRSLESFDAV
jgi:hypothetical protein